MKKISIIGGGNLGSAIAEGLLDSGFINPSHLTITRRNTKPLDRFLSTGVTISFDNQKAIEHADYSIIALKPYQVKDFFNQHRSSFSKGQVVISVVTGLWLNELREHVGESPILFRAMPNTAIAIRQSMTCIAYESASAEQIDFVKELFEKLGRVAIIEEKLMNAATVLGACGTAFAMRYIRANIQGGIEIGFDAHTASFIAAQTIKGAAELLLTNNTHPEAEIDKVTTPKGCTIAGLNEMEHQGFSSSLIKGLITSFEKIHDLK
jgi:pyrroline-5-carboxylate reductase